MGLKKTGILPGIQKQCIQIYQVVNTLFLYKAAPDNNNWNDVTEKKLAVDLATIFYKTTWFTFLLVCFLVAALYAIYIYRTRQQKQVYQLKGKAQLLEKEKALVMYESLKQQLNPHSNQVYGKI